MGWISKKTGELHFENGQRFLVAGGMSGGKPGDPFRVKEAILIRDWTKGDDVHSMGAMGVEGVALDAWKSNYNIHRRNLDRNVNELFGSWDGRSVLILGCGQSLENIKVKPHPDLKIIGTNSVFQFVDEDIVDYYGFMDWKGDPGWMSEGRKYKSTAVVSVVCNPEVLRHFDDVIHYQTRDIPIPGINEEMDRAGLGYLESGLCVVFNMFHLAYEMGAKNIIFAGIDSSYPGNRYRAGVRELKSNPDRNRVVVTDIHGNDVISEDIYILIASCLSCAAFFMKEAGIRVINASNDGIVSDPMELMTLDQVYKEVLGNG